MIENSFTNYCELPTLFGVFRMYDSGNEHLRIITFGDIYNLGDKPIVRIHSSCLASEVFGARDCDCVDQLREAMKLIASEGAGMIIHLHQEGRGQGLSKKILAVHKMQSEGLDTAESFDILGLEYDIRDYNDAIAVLKAVGIKSIRLVSNNPRKKRILEQAGFELKILQTHPMVRPENVDYLLSKNRKFGHTLPLSEKEELEEGPIHFYHSDQQWGELANFSQHAIFIQDKIWQTVEHFYQAQKFIDTELQEKIRLSPSPMLAKIQARELAQTYKRADWTEVKEEFMWQGLLAKFSQHPELRDLLLSTKNRTIAEHSKNDLYWADGGDGSGKNRLGVLLMKLRTDLSSL